MDKWLKSPWVLRIASLFLALLLYTSVNLDDNTSRSGETFIPAGSDTVEVMNNIPLQVFINEDKYVARGVPQNVAVTIDGPNSVVTPTIRKRSFDIYIDLQELDPGKHVVPIKHQGISNKLSVFIEPQSVEITIEERASQTFDVEVDIINDKGITDEFELGKTTITPKQVQVTGSKVEVEKVALVKAIVDVKGAKETIENTEVPVKVYDDQGNELNVYVNPSTVKVKVPLEKPNKSIPFNVNTKGELPKGLSLKSITAEPAEINLYAPQDILDNIEAINRVNIDLSTITEDVTIEADVPIPSGVKKVDPKIVKVTVDVERTEQKTFENVSINVKSLNEDKEITFIDPETNTITLTIIGTREELEEVSEEDFQVYIDVKRYIKGEFKVPIDVEGPETIDWKLSNEEAQIRIE